MGTATLLQAILSSPDKRLTLNQIYDWLISNVVYFTERQDSAASSGWKNSIRHNLSLHQRFLKLPHEDAGKSSWWSLNPEPRSAAAPKQRRRATYGESRCSVGNITEADCSNHCLQGEDEEASGGRGEVARQPAAEEQQLQPPPAVPVPGVQQPRHRGLLALHWAGLALPEQVELEREQLRGHLLLHVSLLLGGSAQISLIQQRLLRIAKLSSSGVFMTLITLLL